MGWTTEFTDKYMNERKKSLEVTNYCTLCRRFVDLKDKYQKEVHENGKRHQKNLKFNKFGL